MPKLTYSDLRTVSFSGLASAVSDWESMTTKLEKLADDARFNGRADLGNGF